MNSRRNTLDHGRLLLTRLSLPLASGSRRGCGPPPGVRSMWNGERARLSHVGATRWTWLNVSPASLAIIRNVI